MSYDDVGKPAKIKFYPKNAVHGQFSAPYSVAIACIERRAFFKEYSEASIQRDDVNEFMKKIRVKPTSDLNRFLPEA